MEIDSEKLREESRASHEKFHWHWSILAGGTLTILVNFIKDITTIDEYSKILLTFAMIFILLSLVFSPIRNLLSTLIVGIIATDRDIAIKKREGFVKKIKILVFFVNIFALFSIFIYIFGLTLIVYANIRLFLS